MQTPSVLWSNADRGFCSVGNGRISCSSGAATLPDTTIGGKSMVLLVLQVFPDTQIVLHVLGAFADHRLWIVDHVRVLLVVQRRVVVTRLIHCPGQAVNWCIELLDSEVEPSL